ncbi:MAG: hypothetical protein N3A02_01575, partial [Rectinema sp.]|nr:hypothetical protein [Rectinema sp.]
MYKRQAVSMISGEQDLGDMFVRDRLKSLYQASGHLLAMQILDRNGLVLWKMPDESAYFATPASGQGSVFNAPAISTVIYMTPLSEGMKLMALYSILSRKDFTDMLMLPIIGVVVWLVLLIIMQFTLKEKPVAQISVPSPPIEEMNVETEGLKEGEPQGGSLPEQEVIEEENSEPGSKQIDYETEVSFEPEPVLNTEAPLESENQSFSEAIEEQTAAEVLQSEEASETAASAPAVQISPPQEKQKEDKIEDAEFIEPTPIPEEIPQPETFPPSLSHQALERLLESELQSRHGELSLMLIECQLSGHDDPSAAALGVTIKEYVTAESLVFEVAKGCYAVALPGVDAGSCLKLAVDLDDMLTATANLYKDISDKPPFYFGISASYG